MEWECEVLNFYIIYNICKNISIILNLNEFEEFDI